ncbi:MAG: hypothetical protein ACK41W_00125 [Cyanobacteriota bacterium]
MPLRFRSRPGAGLPALALLVGLAGQAALAQPVGPNPRGERLTPEQRQRVFPEQRRLALVDHQARIAILRRGESCLNAAANADALRDCLRQEREAMGRQRREFMNEMKALYERNGLAAPQWKQRPGRMGKPPAGPGAEI